MLEIDGRKIEKLSCTFPFELPEGTEVELEESLIDERPRAHPPDNAREMSLNGLNYQNLL
ncbi:MAG: hypothetical protein ACI9SF_000037 [Candidatus Nanohaloarchaea archaeon]|jgi:hypothetical protein